MLCLIHKPSGITSFDLIRKLKKLFPDTKIGHSGTLDPLATGLMLLGLGSDTKKLAEYQKLSKEYEAIIDLSLMSDTRDTDYWELFEKYEITNQKNQIGLMINNQFKLAPSKENISKILNKLIPSFELPVPSFSAKKIQGKKLYDLARDGIITEKFSQMQIFSYEIIKYEFPLLEIKFKVGSGTYIRSIAYWIGQQCGMGGIITKLYRKSIGDFCLE